MRPLIILYFNLWLSTAMLFWRLPSSIFFCLVEWRWQLDECKGSGSGDRRPCSAGPGKEQILRELRIDRDCCSHCLQQASLVLPQSFAAK